VLLYYLNYYLNLDSTRLLQGYGQLENPFTEKGALIERFCRVATGRVEDLANRRSFVA